MRPNAPIAFFTQVAGPCSLTRGSACLSLTQAQTHTHAVLHPACDISAHTRWPTVWQLLAGQPVVQRSQHDFQTLTWLTLHCSHVHVQAHTRVHPYTHTHIHTHMRVHRHISSCVRGWIQAGEGKIKGKIEMIEMKERQGEVADERVKGWVLKELHCSLYSDSVPPQWSMLKRFSSVTDDFCSFLAVSHSTLNCLLVLLSRRVCYFCFSLIAVFHKNNKSKLAVIS